MAGFDLRQEVRLYEAAREEGRPDRFFRDFWEGLRSHQIQPFGHDRSAFATNRLFESFAYDHDGQRVGYGYAQDIRQSRVAGFEAGVRLQESNGSIDTSAFAAIIGQISLSEVLDKFESPEYIGRKLVTVKPASTQQREIIPGIAMMGDKAQKVGEDEDYPRVGVSPNYITVPEKIKRGFISDVTEEAMWEDRLGFIQDALSTGTNAMAVNEEKEILDAVLGISTLYSRNGGALQATYADTHTQGDFDNLVATNTLVDYTDIEALFLAFENMEDPDTGEPVLPSARLQLVVPGAIQMTADSILTATTVEKITNSSALRTLSANPLKRQIEVISSPYVKARTSSESTYFLGDFPGAFQLREVWPIQLFTQGRESNLAFERDVIFRQKVRRKAAPAVVAPWKVLKATAG